MPANKNAIAQGRLELEVKNFGPIVEAKMDLRPLTVLVGPSNTGKSYLAILIYALHRLWSTAVSGPRYFRGGFRSFHPGGLYGHTDNVPEAAFEFAKTIFDRSRENSPENGAKIPASFANILQNNYDNHGIYMEEEIRRFFGIDKTVSLIRRGCKAGGSITTLMFNKSLGTSVNHDFNINESGTSFKITIPRDLLAPIDIDGHGRMIRRLKNFVSAEGAHDDETPEEVRQFHEYELVEALASAVHPLFVGPLAHDAYYLPADRTGIMHAHNVVVGTLIGSAAMAGLRPVARTPMLAGILADFLEELIALGHSPSRRRKLGRGLTGGMEESRFPALQNGIEESILRGEIGVEKSEAVDYPYFTYKPKGWKDSLSLASASSMVSELAPLVLYLRHVVEADDMLIIEEPESHLHPAMQVQLTREIAALVQAGIRVVVTTHSEWVLEELANIVGRSRLSEPEGTALSGSDVGVWLFEPKQRPKGSMVREIPLDDSGLYPTGFGEVAAALHNDWANISSRSQETG